jgi:hypothetical protein
MATFIFLHLFAGIVLGGWFRFAILLPAFAVVAIETIVAAIYPMFWPWYLILIVGVAAIQLGYVAASFFRPRRVERPEPSTTRPSVSTPE